MVPQYGTLGAAFSTLIAFVASSIMSIIWSERIVIRYIAICITAIIAGVIAGHIIDSIVGKYYYVEVLFSIGVTMVIIVMLKNTSAIELGYLVKTMVNRSKLS